MPVETHAHVVYWLAGTSRMGRLHIGQQLEFPSKTNVSEIHHLPQVAGGAGSALLVSGQLLSIT